MTGVSEKITGIPHYAICVFRRLSEEYCPPKAGEKHALIAVYGDFIDEDQSPMGEGCDFNEAIESLLIAHEQMREEKYRVLREQKRANDEFAQEERFQSLKDQGRTV